MNKKLLIVAGAALLVSGCTTTGDTSRLGQAIAVCEIGLRGIDTVGEVATVLERNGFAPEHAHKVADKAIETGNVAHFVCQTLIAANAVANTRK